MGSNPKGHALIINIHKVIGLDDRDGSNVDFVDLIKLFEGLDYVVQQEVELTEKVNMKAPFLIFFLKNANTLKNFYRK